MTVSACNELTGAAGMSVAEGAATATRPSGSSSAGLDGEAPQPAPDAETVAPGTFGVIAPVGLDFGSVFCGATAERHPVEIHNPGPRELSFTATFAGSAFGASPTSGTVAAGEKGVVLVSVNVIPTTGGIGVRSDQLTITTTFPGDEPHKLESRVLATGAMFDVTPSGSMNFGDVKLSESRTITIRNDGNIDGTLAFSLVSTTFDVVPTTAAVLGPGASVTRSVKANPSGSTTKYGTLSFTSPTPFCRALPASISLRARQKEEEP